MDQSKMNFLQSVLRYSASQASDGTSSTALEASAASESSAPTAAAAVTTSTRGISPERRQWLQDALDNMSINPIDEMKKCMRVVEQGDDVDEETAERQVEALETLKDWCEDMNFAIDFHKLGGYPLVVKTLESSRVRMRTLACDMLATCAQNNPYCQETMLAARILPLMFDKLDKDVDDVKIKALYAISCLTRDYEPGQQQLIDESDSLDILIRSLRSSVEKLQTKSCFLCSSICNNKVIKGLLTNKRLIETLIDMYRQEESNIHEHVLSAISVLIDDNPLAIQQAKQLMSNDVITFKQMLTNRVVRIADDPRYDEEREMATRILESLFQN